MRRLFNWLFRKLFLRLYLAEQNKPILHSDLDFAFTDSTGKRYYEFNTNQAIPLPRYNKLKSYISYMQLRLTPENLDELIDKALGLITEGIGKDKNAARVAALLHEIKERGERIIPAELIYNYLAVLYVREDEQPGVFNQHIHMEKVDQFIAEASSGDTSGFFFRLKEWKRLTGSSLMSQQEWSDYLETSHRQELELIEKMRIYTTAPTSQTSSDQQGKP